MSRRFSPFLPVLIMVLVIVVIAVPLWIFFDWRERVWRDQCQAQGGHPARVAYDSELLCLDDDNRIVLVQVRR